MAVKIKGSGSYIPTQVVTNNDFHQFDFRDETDNL